MSEKVLQVVGGIDRGGATIFITNNLKYNDNNKITYDFLIRQDYSAYRSLIEASGGTVYVMPEFPKRFIKNWIETKHFFKNNAGKYSAIHVHANALLYMLPLKLAKKYGIKVRIIHSHNTKANKPIYGIIHKYNVKRVHKYANVFYACGMLAGKWMFKDKNFEVINNAIDINKFAFECHIRNRVREELQISETTIVIGHVGRFEEAKNHIFLLEVYYKYLEKNSDAKLLLVGTGSQETMIKEKVRELNIEDKVIFLGARDDVNCIYQAMDIFLLPSLFEGFPFVLVEAQTNGLPCIVSNNVSEECAVTDLVHSLSLEESVDVWADAVLRYAKRQENASYHSELMREKGYDIKDTSEKLLRVYLGQDKK
jgi:glycosyltransferase involved in cell wall biosynthesis